METILRTESQAVILRISDNSKTLLLKHVIHHYIFYVLSFPTDSFSLPTPPAPKQ